MKRIFFILFCALILGGTVPGSARADRVAYDNPSDPGAGVGDDDEPFVTTPPPQTPQTLAPQLVPAGAHRPSRVVASWVTDALHRLQSIIWAARDRIAVGKQPRR